MNTAVVVWLLMMPSYSGHIPMLEFTTEQKCLTASKRINDERNQRSWVSNKDRSWCMWIEK